MRTERGRPGTEAIYSPSLSLTTCISLSLSPPQAGEWDFLYGVHYAWHLVIYTMVIAFSLTTPVITPVGKKTPRLINLHTYMHVTHTCLIITEFNEHARSPPTHSLFKDHFLDRPIESSFLHNILALHMYMSMYMYVLKHVYVHVYHCTCTVGYAVLLYLVVCLTLLASLFLPSFICLTCILMSCYCI